MHPVGIGKSLLVIGPHLPGHFGSLSGPETLAVDAKSAIYVADRDNARIIKFSARGRPVAVWKLKRGNRPYGLAVDSAGRIYVSEFIGSSIFYRSVVSSTVLVLSPRGEVLAEWK